MINFKEWQTKAYSLWKNSGFRGTVKAATGTGKTFVALKVIEQHPYETILIVVPTIALQNQWYNEIVDNNIAQPNDIGLVNGHSKQFKSLTIAVVNSIRDKINLKYDILVLDEVHRMFSEENVKFIKQGFYAYILGLSATPERSDSQLIYMYAPVIYEYKRKAAIDDKTLSNFTVMFYGVDLKKKDAAIYNKNQNLIYALKKKFGLGMVRNYMDYPFKLRQAFSRRKLMIDNYMNKQLKAVDIIKHNPKSKVIVFTERVKTADEIYEKIDDCVIYHGSIDRYEREQSLEDFATGKSRVLVTVKALDEGLNVPDCNMGIIVSGTKVQRQIIQRIGRILRKKKGKHATLVFIYLKNTTEFAEMKKKEKMFKDEATKILWK